MLFCFFSTHPASIKDAKWSLILVLFSALFFSDVNKNLKAIEEEACFRIIHAIRRKNKKIAFSLQIEERYRSFLRLARLKVWDYGLVKNCTSLIAYNCARSGAYEFVDRKKYVCVFFDLDQKKNLVR